jgi:predicted RNase H-like HicB family nuclease
MIFSIEVEEETDGRWLAEVTTLPGVLSYGVTRTDSMARVQALALRTLAEKMENGEAVLELLSVSFQAA